MLNYFYVYEVNSRHPHVAALSKQLNDELSHTSNSTSHSWTSIPYVSQDAAFRGMEENLNKYLERIVRADKTFNQINRIKEDNPLYITPYPDIERMKTEDEGFARYLSTWDKDTLTRVTCTTEDLKFAPDGTLNEFPATPEHKVLSCSLRVFDDGLTIPEGTILATNYTSLIH